MHDEYKATREKTPDELVEQIPAVKEIAEVLGCPLVEMVGFEADDLIGTLAKQAVASGLDVVIVTGDKDLMQLVNENVSIYNPRKAGTEIERLDPQGVEAKFGVPPDKVIDGVLKVGGPGPWGKIAVIVGLVFCVTLGLLARARRTETA